MSCLIWNARGLGNPCAFREFRRLLVDVNPGLIFVSETKMTRANSGWWREALGYDGLLMVDCVGNSGGLLLLWKYSFTVSLFSYSVGHIDCGVESFGKKWRFTGFYGNPDPMKRGQSWILLRRLAGMHEYAHLPWMVGGDFNAITSGAEKKGGSKKSFAQMDEFRRVFEELNLIEFHGAPKCFTWTNKRKGEDEILERLDRFVFSLSWTEMFAIKKMEILDEYGSDHRAIFLNMGELSKLNVESGKRRFHFEQKWFYDKDFATDFLLNWYDTKGDNMEDRLRRSQVFFTQWAGSRFDSLGKQIQTTRTERVAMLNRRDRENIEDDLARISDRLRTLTNKEEMHWRQRSRANWLADKHGFFTIFKVH